MDAARLGGIDWTAQPLRQLWRLSSRGRGWLGFDAALIQVSGGTSRPTILARHSVVMLVGSSLRTVAMCDDVVERRDQATGSFDVLPGKSSVSWIDEGSSTFLAVNMDHDLICSTAFEMGLEPNRLQLVPRLTCRDPRIEHILWALKVELETPEPQGTLYADSLGIALATQLVRRCTPSLPLAVPCGGMSKRRLRRVLDHIDDRLAHELGLGDIAAVAGVSPSHLNLLFKQSMGTSVHKYVVRRRVERAVDLLRHTNEAVSDIALRTGFANQSHMSRCLRSAFGVTPRSLREAL